MPLPPDLSAQSQAILSLTLCLVFFLITLNVNYTQVCDTGNGVGYKRIYAMNRHLSLPILLHPTPWVSQPSALHITTLLLKNMLYLQAL